MYVCFNNFATPKQKLYNPTDTSAQYFYARFGQKRKWILERGFIENTMYVAHFGLGMTWNVEHVTCSDSFSPPLKYLSEFGDKNTFHHSLEFL